MGIAHRSRCDGDRDPVVLNLTVRSRHDEIAALPLLWRLPSFRHPTVHYSTHGQQHGG